MDALLLAAGYATRLYPITERFPKPLLKVGQETVLDRLVRRIEQSGVCRSITIVTNDRFFPHFRTWADERPRGSSKCEVFLVNDGTENNDKRLGAVRDLHLALSHPSCQRLNGTDLLVCACDNLIGLDFARLFDFYAQTRDPVVAVHPEANRERLHLVGVVELKEDMYIKVMEEKPARPKSDLACCPIYLFPPSALKLVYVYLEEGGNPDAPGHFLSWLVARMPVRAFLFHEPVYALDSIEMYYWLNDNAERVDKELGYGRAVGKTE